MKKLVAMLLLVGTALVAGCGGSTPAAAQPAPSTQTVPAQDAGTAVPTVPTQTETGSSAVVKPAWTFQADAKVAQLFAVEGKTDLGVVLLSGSSYRLIRLDAQGKPVGQPLSLQGAPTVAGPDLSRFIVSSENSLSVVDQTGKQLWSQKTGKALQNATLLPDGKTVVLSTVTEAMEGVETVALDLSGTQLWRLEGAQAGDVYHAGDKALILGSNQGVWRLGTDGNGRKDLLSSDQVKDAALEISGDGSTIAVVREDGGALFDAEGRKLADIGGGTPFYFSGDGQRLLVKRGKATYVMIDRKGQEVFTLESPRSLQAHAVTVDGSFWLTAMKSPNKDAVQVTLYDSLGKQVWESSVPLSSENREASLSVALNKGGRLAYLAVGKQVFSWALPER